jgi:molybdate transport repressor ModE-like protein
MDKLAAMKIFVTVVEAGSLSAAARRLGISLTSVSRQLAALEDVVGTPLVQRTTRHLSLTEAGHVYNQHAGRILDDIAEAELSVASQTAVATGRLHVATPSLLGRRVLAPLLPNFLSRHPRVSVDLTLADRPFRLAEEGIDVALHIGKLPDSSLIGRKLSEIQLVVCGSPAYLRQRGEPLIPDGLTNHDCLGFGEVSGGAEWHFQQDRTRRTIKIATRLQTNDLDALLAAAVGGVGLARVPSWQINDELTSGRLKIVLASFQRPATPLHALILRNRLQSPKVRTFVDYLVKAWQ